MTEHGEDDCNFVDSDMEDESVTFRDKPLQFSPS